MPPATITLYRDASWRDGPLSYSVQIDGKRVGRLWPDVALTVEVVPGTHGIGVRTRWFGAGEGTVVVAAGERCWVRVAAGRLHLRTLLTPRRWLWVLPD